MIVHTINRNKTFDPNKTSVVTDFAFRHALLSKELFEVIFLIIIPRVTTKIRHFVSSLFFQKIHYIHKDKIKLPTLN